MKPKTNTKSRATTGSRASSRTSSAKNAKQTSKLAWLSAQLNTTKGKMLAFAVTFGVLGLAYLAFSSAATPPKYFSPTGTLTRQAAAAFLYRQASSPAPAATTKCGSGKPGPYADVSATQEFCKEIEWAGSKGIMTPDAKNNINPTGEVTRQAMAAFMYRAANSPAYTVPKSIPFADVPTTNTFFKEINWMKYSGYTTGYPDGTFKPTEVITRQAAASYIYKQAGSPAVDVPQIFADTPSTNPFYKAIQWMGNTNVAKGFTEEPKSATCIKVDTGAKYACTPTQKIQNDKDVATKKANDEKWYAEAKHQEEVKFYEGLKHAQEEEFYKGLQRAADEQAARDRQHAYDVAHAGDGSGDGSGSSDPCSNMSQDACLSIYLCNANPSGCHTAPTCPQGQVPTPFGFCSAPFTGFGKPAPQGPPLGTCTQHEATSSWFHNFDHHWYHETEHYCMTRSLANDPWSPWLSWKAD